MFRSRFSGMRTAYTQNNNTPSPEPTGIEITTRQDTKTRRIISDVQALRSNDAQLADSQADDATLMTDKLKEKDELSSFYENHDESPRETTKLIKSAHEDVDELRVDLKDGNILTLQ
jgi:hypothetical protein